MNKSILAILTLSGFLAGCATPAHSVRVFEDYPPRSDFANVEVIRTLPERDYIVVAEFETRGNSLNALRKQAAKYGADAVFVANYSNYFSETSVELRNNSKSGISLGSESLCTAIKYR